MRSGAPTGVLCNVVCELQKYIAPLLSLNGDNIVEALLLEPTGDKPRTSPTLEKEAASWEKNWSCWRLQKLLHPYRNVQKLLIPRNLLSRLMLWVPMWNQNPTVPHPRKQRVPRKGLSPKAHQLLIQISPATGSWPTSRRAERYLTCGGNSRPFTIRVLSPSMTFKFNP